VGYDYTRKQTLALLGAT